MRTQFITDAKGTKISAIVPIKEYESILEQLDELHCIKAYDKVKSKKQHFVPATEFFEQVEKRRNESKTDV